MYLKPKERVKKLVLVLATSTPVILIKEEVVETAKTVETIRAGKNGKIDNGGKYLRNLAKLLYIHYLITFQRTYIWALLDLSNEINAILPTFDQELEFPIKPTNIRVHKMYGNIIDIYGMRVAAFSMTKKANQVKFFEKTFLVANISLKIVYGMFFLILSNVDINFLNWKL